MPIYDFECRECGKNFEQLVRREADIEQVSCPSCSARHVTRALSLPAAPATTGAGAMAMPMGGGCGPGPSCGKPWCQRTG